MCVFRGLKLTSRVTKYSFVLIYIRYVLATETEGLRELTQHTILPSLAGGEWPAIYTVIDGSYRPPRWTAMGQKRDVVYLG